MQAEARPDASAGSNFPADQGLKLDSASKPSIVGAPVVVTAVRTDTSQQFGDLRNLFRSRVTFRRLARDGGRERFLLVKVGDAKAGCLYFASLLTPSVRSSFKAQCVKLSGVDLSIYASIDYQLSLKAVGAGEKTFKPNTTDGADFGDENRVELKNAGDGAASQLLLRKVKPGRYQLEVRTKIEFASHPVISPILRLKEFYDDWIAQPFEIVEGPTGWAIDTIKDEIVDAVIEEARSRALDTTAVYAFQVPAVVPKLKGLRPSRARLLLQALNLKPKLVKEQRIGAGRPSEVVAQSAPPGTLLHAGTEVEVTYAVYTPATTPPVSGTGWTGEWTWHATNDVTGGAFQGQMTIAQQGATVCASWDFSGGGSAKGSVSGNSWSGARWYDGFGQGTWTLTLAPDGKTFGGTQTITRHSTGETYTATIKGTRVSTPSQKLDCSTLKVGP